MKKRILHVLPSTGFAGAENVAITIIANLQEHFVCAYASPNGSIADILDDRGIAYIPMRKFSTRQLRKVIKQWQPDLIHAHDFKATMACVLSTVSIPVVSHIHQNPAWLKSLTFRSILFFMACCRLHMMIAVSPAIIEHSFLTCLFKRKVVVIKNSVNPSWLKERAAEEKADPSDLVFIGRYEAIKDPLRFIDIVERVAKEVPTVKAVMIGGGSLEDACRKAIQAKGLSHSIQLNGFMANPYPYVSNSKILVMTSKSEGLPLAAIEALALGKPLVVSRLKGIEQIVDKGCGFICTTDEEFVARLAGLLQSDREYTGMSVAAFRKAEELCSIELFTAQMKKVYDNAFAK